MKGRRAVRIAAGLAAEVEACLLRAGCTPPPREDLTAALWPFARTVVAAQKMLRRAEAFHRAALEYAAAAEAQCTDAMTLVADAWAQEHPPVLDPVEWAERIAREAVA